jgi:hypothetical protein
MSTLKADTIQSTSGGAATLTKQAAAKVTFGMNLRSSTSMDLATNAISTECLNISSGTDAGTGLARGNITNAMQNKQYIWVEGCIAANNVSNLDIGVATTSLIPFQQHDADTGNDSDVMSYAAVFGDLA